MSGSSEMRPGAAEASCALIGLLRLIHPGQRIRPATLKVLAARSGCVPPPPELSDPQAFSRTLAVQPALRCLVLRDADGGWWRRRWNASERRGVVIDLNNVLWTCRPTSAGSALVASAAFPALRRLARLGVRPLGMVADHSLYAALEEGSDLAALETLGGPLQVAPAGTPADPILLAMAQRLGCLVLSNDRFRDWRGESAWHRRNLHRLRLPLIAPDGFGEAEAELGDPPPTGCAERGGGEATGVL